MVFWENKLLNIEKLWTSKVRQKVKEREKIGENAE